VESAEQRGDLFMVVKLFILGRPGSGKSTAINWFVELAERRGYSATHIRDYAILSKMFKKDIHQEKFLPDGHEGFIVKNFHVKDFHGSVLDDALQELEKHVKACIQELQRSSKKKKEILLIEFARDDYDKALNNFTPEFLENAYFLFVDLDLEKCIERIHLRRDNNSPVRIKQNNNVSRLDCHFVSDSVMRDYYHINIWSKLQEISEQDAITQNIKVIDNSKDWETFISNVSGFAEAIFDDKEFSSNQPPESQPPENHISAQPASVEKEAMPV